jgi:protocatechuate 3,4-dioxygenase beta subunit
MTRRVLTITVALTLFAPVSPGAFAQTPCRPTRPDALGPFYEANAPERASTGRGLVIAGRVLSSAGCAPLSGARIEWWSANPRGEYDAAHRATEVSGADGRYRYETDAPGRYPGRPPHVHVRVTAPGHAPLVTQVYPKSSETAVELDIILARE